jgi:hypothetical protein
MPQARTDSDNHAEERQRSAESNQSLPEEATPVTEADAPEENNVSRTAQDNRPPHQLQPPTKEQY